MPEPKHLKTKPKVGALSVYSSALPSMTRYLTSLLTILASALCAVHQASAIFVVGPDFPITINSFEIMGIIDGQVSTQYLDPSFEHATTLEMSDPSTNTSLQADWRLEMFDDSISTEEGNSNFGIGAHIGGLLFLSGPESVATLARITFTLTAPVKYHIDGIARVVAQETGGVNSIVAGFGPPPTITAVSLVDTGPAMGGVPPKLFAPLPVLTGTLLPGQYVFETISTTFGGPKAENNVNFGLVAKPAPDGGSTLLLLGMALIAAFKFFPRRGSHIG